MFANFGHRLAYILALLFSLFIRQFLPLVFIVIHLLS